MSEGKHSENEDGSWTEKCLNAITVRIKMAQVSDPKHSENEDGSWTEKCLKASRERMNMTTRLKGV